MSDLRFEQLGPEHVDEIQRLVENDRTIIENTLMPDPYPPDGARQFVDRMHPDRERAFAILDADGALAGVCGMKLHADAAELGYWVAAGHRGRGVGSAAAGELIRVARELGYRRVRAQTRASNVGSRRVLERAGLRLEGIRPNGDETDKWPADEPMADYGLDLA